MKKDKLVVVAVIWTLALIVGSLSPSKFKVAVGANPAQLIPSAPHHRASPPHRFSHIMVFAVTAALYISLARTTTGLAWGIAGAVALGVGLETAQALVYHYHDFEWWDVRDDLIGTLIAAAAYLAVRSEIRRQGLIASSKNLR